MQLHMCLTLNFTLKKLKHFTHRINSLLNLFALTLTKRVEKEVLH